MDACREALTLTRRYIADAEVWVCEEHGQPLGVAGFQATGEQVDLDLMFVDPAAIGAGSVALCSRESLPELGIGGSAPHYRE